MRPLMAYLNRTGAIFGVMAAATLLGGCTRIVGHQGTYARVEPVKSEIAAPAGGFWIDEGILRPKGK